jgi:hypothetical protein
MACRTPPPSTRCVGVNFPISEADPSLIGKSTFAVATTPGTPGLTPGTQGRSQRRRWTPFAPSAPAPAGRPAGRPVVVVVVVVVVVARARVEIIAESKSMASSNML